MSSLAGKRVLVTGASRGAGHGIARAFAAAGAEVIATARSADKLAQLQALITADGGRCAFIPGDLATRAGVRAIAAQCGEIDVLVNNAALTLGANVSLLEQTDADWDMEFAINVTAPITLMQALVPGMIARGAGRVINISSIAAARPNPHHVAYAASKAASDHLVRAYCHTFGLPVLTTNCPNNYGPFQFPEKLIPLVTLNALEGKQLPVYGDGKNVRDWLFVEDHCSAIRAVLQNGRIGETYNIGGNSERTNIDVVTTICDLVDEMRPGATDSSRRKLITFVEDRPGHDRRYAIDAAKISRELGWKPAEQFESGLRKTVRWYLDNTSWVNSVRTGAYREWIAKNYSERTEL